MYSRRHFLQKASLFTGTFSAIKLGGVFAQSTVADRNVLVRNMEVFTVSVTNRTNWIIVSLTAAMALKA